MTFKFPLNPSNNQIIESPLGQKFIFVAADDGWRSLGPAKSPAGSAGVSISSTVFFVGAPMTITLSAASEGTGNGINPPYTFVVTSGDLPTGITLTSYGVLSGIPLLANEQYSFTVSVLDALSFLISTIIFSGTVSAILTGDALTYLNNTFAPILSPIFKGTPTVPTPATGNKSLNIANTAFVASAISTALLDHNLTGLSALQNTVNGMSATISSLQSISVSSASSLASLTTTVTALSSLNSLQAAVNAEILARVGGDNALASDIITITATANGNTAAITNESIARATAIEALATSVSNLTTTVGSNTAAITTEATTRSTAVLAMANTITSLTAAVNGNTAAISSETNARADAISATASNITSLTATVNGHTAAISVNEAAIATVDGYVSTSYGVTLDSDHYATGFQILNGGSPATSAFIVRADLFEVIAPGTAATPLFIVSDIGGVPTVSITGNIIQNGVEALTLTFAPQTTWYVNFGSGNNTTGDGKTPGTAWATIQHAIDFISSHFVYAGTITIQCANGTFTVAPGENWAAIVTNAQIGSWNLQGNISSPGACVIDASGYACRGFGNAGSASVTVTGFTIHSFQEALASMGGGVLYAGNINLIGVLYSSSSKSIGFAVYSNSTLTFVNGATINISGWYGACFSAGGGGLLQIGWHDGLGGTSYVTLNFASPHFYVSCMNASNAEISFDTAMVNITGVASGYSYTISQGYINTSLAGAGAIPGTGTGYITNYGILA